ncbi:MAG TPA: L,D-transpeptidase family protein [Gammaproteobacteria bacterium]|nr:L,D-transpeptidase family protein [Gammaproteobacteria bacterium]
MRKLIDAAHAGVAVALLLWQAVAFGQSATDLIRTHVEELRVGGHLEVLGQPIASRTVLPHVYENRKFAPAWENLRRVDELLEMIDQSYLEGLDPSDYHAAALRAFRATVTELDAVAPTDRAAFDVLLTDSIIRLGYHLRFGKIDPSALDPNWNQSRTLGPGEDAAVTIQKAISSPSLREFAAKVIPRVFLYQRFKAALAEYRAIEARGGWPSVPAGPALRPGATDERVPALASRLAVTGDLPASSAPPGTLYDETLVAATQRFQARHGLAADGIVGAGTLAALNVPVGARIDQLRVSLERARQVFYDPESEFLVVNIAGFQLYIVRRGEIVFRARVQVGKPYRQTPIFRAEMTYLVVNPTWTVPPTIFRNDILPAVRRDLGYLASRNIDAFDSSGAMVDPATANWSGRNPPYRLVQRPGPDNALGRIKFMFPNEHSVYLHDTPSRDLFDRDSRAFSSGCIRVENPFELAGHLLGSARARERLEALVARGKTQTVFLDKPMTVMLLYWTAEVDAAGRVSFFPDVYQRDAAVITALAEPFRAPATL